MPLSPETDTGRLSRTSAGWYKNLAPDWLHAQVPAVVLIFILTAGASTNLINAVTDCGDVHVIQALSPCVRLPAWCILILFVQAM